MGPFALDSSGMPLPLPDDRIKNFFLSPSVVSADGFGNLTVDDSDGNISVPQSTAIKTSPGGSVTLSAANLSILGSISAPGGSLTFNVFDISPTVFANLPADAPIPAVDPTRGGFTLGSAARLDTGRGASRTFEAARRSRPARAIWRRAGRSRSRASAWISGPAVSSLPTAGSPSQAPGQITYGAGGSISLAAGQDINIPGVFGGVFSGKLNLGATLSGLSGATGGSLSILAPFIQVGGQSSHPSTLLLSPDFFRPGWVRQLHVDGSRRADRANGRFPACRGDRSRNPR